MPVSIRPAHAPDALQLAIAGERMFRVAYEAQNDRAQIDLYCRTTYGEQLQLAEITRVQAITLIAFDDAEVAGFAQLDIDRAAPSGAAFHRPVEVKRFYVDQAHQGTGLALELMAAALAAARVRGCDGAWLAVWKENPRAIRFYTKAGFTIVGDTTFLLGTEEQYDHVMARTL